MESQLAEAMPRLVKLCHDRDLRQLVQKIADETPRHRDVVEGILADLDAPIEADPCKAIAGLIEGGEEHLHAVDEPYVRDMMMIAHCLRIEHYRIAAYGITSRLGERLGLREEAGPLKRNLDEEKAAARVFAGLEDRLQEPAHHPAEK
jgi:Mn-containing catalase